MSSAGFHALKIWSWRMRMRRNLNPPVFGTEKCRVRELEKVRFGERMRPILYRNRSPLMRQEGAAVRPGNCCAKSRESRYIWKTYVCRDTLFSGGLFFLKIIFD